MFSNVHTLFCLCAPTWKRRRPEICSLAQEGRWNPNSAWQRAKRLSNKSFQCSGTRADMNFEAVNFPLGKQKLFTNSRLHFSAPWLSCPTVKQIKLSLTSSYSSFIYLKTSCIFLGHSVMHSSNCQISPPTATSSRLSNSASMFIFSLIVFLQIFPSFVTAD